MAIRIQNPFYSSDAGAHSSERHPNIRMKRNEESPDDTSRYCSGKVIAPPSCKQSSEGKGGKN